ncbi:N-acetylglucosamine-6-phosphate deacetylase [Desulfurococcaceae archaeon MEX13E-LK6-19]|nr:N-acetylglucosamine-6-phosphate deacetylase [Desulfurococcaceae archaeon MEX13E-LK6-19]
MPGELLIRHARIYTPLTIIDNGFIYIKEGIIKDVGSEPCPIKCSNIINAEDLIVAPGFIDTHIHGYKGYDSNDCKPESFLEISKLITRHGVTAFIPSTVTASHETLLEASKAVYEAIKSWNGGGARILGLHLEGPYISKEKRGAQNPEYIRPASRQELREYIKASNNHIRQITVAPEAPGVIDLIPYAVENEITVSIGHTNASYEETRKAIEAGASKATHLYNAMKSIHHREPGPIIALLENPGVYIELITDFIHVSKPMVKFTIDYAGYERIVLITDAISATMLPDGKYSLGGLDVIVEKGVPRLASTHALAGSTLTMDKAVRNVYSLGYSLQQVLSMATLNPAKSIHAIYREKIGLIKPGFKADIVFLDENLEVVKTMVEGELVYEK